MEIHKPKPVHSWRELLTEIGVVVIGVGIALAAEQAVEWLHWRVQVADAREVIATELTENLVAAFRRIRTADCVDRRLDQLSLILDAASKKGSLPPIGDIGVPYRSTYPDGAWASVIASPAATHFPRERLAAIASVYKGIDRIREFNSQELVAWNSLYAMVGPGRRLDPASEAKLRDALSQARADSRSVAYLAASVIDEIRSMQIHFGQEDLKQLAAAEHDPSVRLTSSTLDASGIQMGICAPMGAAPASYGQGLVSVGLGKTLQQIVQSPPDFSKDSP
jgi:hypothetical protein